MILNKLQSRNFIILYINDDLSVCLYVCLCVCLFVCLSWKAFKPRNQAEPDFARRSK